MTLRTVRRCVSIVFALLAGTVASHASEPPGRRTAAVDSAQFLTWTHNEAPMGLFLPAKAGKPLPVVMFLHGCHNDPVFREHWIIGALNAIEPTAVFLPTAPETPNTQYPCADWGGTYDAKIRPQMQDALHELDSLVKAHGLDTTRQYLYGESMGGEGVYRLLSDFPARFAGAVDVAGYTPNKKAAEMARTPLWIVIGTEDEMSPIADARAIHEAIVAAGGDKVKFTEYPELGHVPAIEKARTDSTYLGWLLAQVRAPVVGVDPLRSGSIRSKAPLEFVGGTLRVSASLAPETTLEFFGLDGTLLLRADAKVRTIVPPSSMHGRMICWRASRAGAGVGGRFAILPR